MAAHNESVVIGTLSLIGSDNILLSKEDLYPYQSLYKHEQTGLQGSAHHRLASTLLYMIYKQIYLTAGPSTAVCLKGTVSRDFRFLVFIMNQFPSSP
jgi:hypothetical protein